MSFTIAVNCRLQMFRREMSIHPGHVDRAMAEEFGNLINTDARHYQTRGKIVPAT
jgi:hypothetical protein